MDWRFCTNKRWIERLKFTKKSYIIGGVILIFLIILIIIIIFVTRSSDDGNKPEDPPNISDPDEVPLPFTNTLIIKINDSTLWARDIDSENFVYVIKNWTTRFHSFDFYRKKTIYFGSVEPGEAITSYSKRFSQFGQPGTWYANQIAVDHVHEKVYVLDGLSAKINIFDIQSSYYNIISIDLNQPKDIAVDPVKKILFILQFSSIIKCNLDGSSPEIIYERTDISAFQIDVDQKRIYWATAHEIQSSDYAGHNVITAIELKNTALSLAVLNNNLFWLIRWSDQERPTLWHCKIINGVCSEISSAIFDDDAVEIKAYNFKNLQVTNPCQSMTDCEHMCINSNNGPKCICTIGWQLKNDSQTCETIDEFLIYVQGDFVKGRILDHTKKVFTTAFLPFQLNISLLTKKQTLDFDFDVRNNEILFGDDHSMYKINLKPDSQQILMGGDSAATKVNPAVDWIAGNVYFVRLIYRDFFDIGVQKIAPYDSSRADKVTLTIRENYTPRSLVVHPNRGFLFLTLSDDLHKEKVEIVRIHLDGTGRRSIGQNLSISDLENGLVIDYDEDRLFWFDKTMKNVHSADLECSNLQTIDVSIVENPKMINIYDDYVYISNLTSIWRFDKKTGQDVLKIFPAFGYESQPIRGAKVFSRKSQVIDNNNPCAVNNGGCKRFCFTKSKVTDHILGANILERVCECNNNEKLDSDGKNCISNS